MKYATINAEGIPTSFYSEDVHGDNIPEGATPITEDQWLEFINNAGYRRWDGGNVVPYEPPLAEPPFPSIVSASQAKIALFNAGLLDEVEAVVAAHPYRVVRIWFMDANQWERGNPYVQALGVEIGLDDAAIDALFVAASKV